MQICKPRNVNDKPKSDKPAQFYTFTKRSALLVIYSRKTWVGVINRKRLELNWKIKEKYDFLSIWENIFVCFD